MHQLTLTDVVVVVLVALSVAAALRRGSGVLGALGAAATTAVLAWVAVVALVSWTTGPVARAAGESRLLHAVPAPHRAVAEADRLVRRLTGH